MIEVKGARTGTKPADPAEAYADRHDPGASRKPHVIAMLLVAVAAWLKSLVPAGAAQVPGDEAGGEAGAAPDPAPRAARPAPSGAEGRESGPGHWLADEDWGSLLTHRSTIPGHGGPPFLQVTTIATGEDFGKLPMPFLGAVSGWAVPFPANSPWATGPGAAMPLTPGPPGTRPGPGAGDHLKDGPEDGPEQDDPERGTNRAPRHSGPVQLADIAGGAVGVIWLAHLLRNSRDPDGDPLSVTGLTLVSGNGTLTRRGEVWDYATDDPHSHTVTLRYLVSDGEFAVEQFASFEARPFVRIEGTEARDLLIGSIWRNEIDGGAGDDNILGRGRADVIMGGEGDDLIHGGGGNDTIFGGPGNDTIFGGAGDDVIHGGDGDDLIRGGAGNDILMGDAGDDTIHGGAGDDVIFGGDGDDLIRGGAGNDILTGDAGDDTIHGGEGDDTIEGGDGDDLILGGDGDDLLVGGSGSDTIHAGAGDDTIVSGSGSAFITDGPGRDLVLGGTGGDHLLVSPDGENDIFHGGAGWDTLDFSETAEGVHVDLVNGIASGAEIGEDGFDGFEEIAGGDGDDHFVIGDDPVVLVAGGGSSLFEFTGGGETVVHEIHNFKYGDRIRISEYKLFKEIIDELESDFKKIYGKAFDDDKVPFVVRHDELDGIRRTVIEADLNRDDSFETIILVQGSHVLTITEVTA